MLFTLVLLACTGPGVAPQGVEAVVAAAPPVVAPSDPVPAELYAAAADSTVAHQRLRHLSTHIGHRLASSPRMEEAVRWAAAELEADGFAVRLEPVEIPAWVRGEESLTLLAPEERDLDLLALGHSIGTSAEGIEAEVVVVGSYDELDALPDDAVAGRIVLYDVPFTTYRDTVQYRVQGATRAAERGALAALVRSVTSESLYTPHTGAMSRTDEAPTVPAAAITIEDAEWLHRLQEDGVVPRVRLIMGARTEGTVTSHNVVADLPGRALPEEIVVVSGHLDSWDVGQGAQDDGAGCMIAWEAARLIAAREAPPRRTLRVVLYTAEEIGVFGGDAYVAARSEDELGRHVALLESDTGNGRADGFRVDLRRAEPLVQGRLAARLAELQALLEPLGGGDLSPGYSGADISKVVVLGRPGLGMRHDTTTYWPIHHTPADTFDKIVLEDLQHNIGLMAAAAWWLAESEDPVMPLGLAPPEE